MKKITLLLLAAMLSGSPLFSQRISASVKGWSWQPDLRLVIGNDASDLLLRCETLRSGGVGSDVQRKVSRLKRKQYRLEKEVVRLKNEARRATSQGNERRAQKNQEEAYRLQDRIYYLGLDEGEFQQLANKQFQDSLIEHGGSCTINMNSFSQSGSRRVVQAHLFRLIDVEGGRKLERVCSLSRQFYVRDATRYRGGTEEVWNVKGCN